MASLGRDTQRGHPCHKVDGRIPHTTAAGKVAVGFSGSAELNLCATNMTPQPFLGIAQGPNRPSTATSDHAHPKTSLREKFFMLYWWRRVLEERSTPNPQRLPLQFVPRSCKHAASEPASTIEHVSRDDSLTHSQTISRIRRVPVPL